MYDDDDEDEDEIIAELHRIRWKIYEEAGGTPRAYLEHYIKMGEERLAAEKAAAEAAEKAARSKRRKPAKTAPKAAPKTAARKPARRRSAVTA